MECKTHEHHDMPHLAGGTMPFGVGRGPCSSSDAKRVRFKAQAMRSADNKSKPVKRGCGLDSMSLGYRFCPWHLSGGLQTMLWGSSASGLHNTVAFLLPWPLQPHFSLKTCCVTSLGARFDPKCSARPVRRCIARVPYRAAMSSPAPRLGAAAAHPNPPGGATRTTPHCPRVPLDTIYPQTPQEAPTVSSLRLQGVGHAP